MSDDDMIRLSDAITALRSADLPFGYGHAAEVIRALPAVQVGVKPECGHPWCGDKCGTDVSTAQPSPDVTVWYGSMPESNGRANWTASLHRKGGDAHLDGFCFARSEYPDRVRYVADRVRWIIGELPEKPHILDYDADAHSGYAEPAKPSPDVAALVEVLAVLRHAVLDALRQSSDMEYCLNLFGLAARTDLPRETLRGIIADMRADGLVSYHKGLWTEEGMPGGAGYAITDAGRAALARLKGGAA